MHDRVPLAILILAPALLAGCPAPGEGEVDPAGDASPSQWEILEPGLELGTFPPVVPPDPGNSAVRVLRIDPGRFELRLMNASAEEPRAPRTAREWAVRYGLVAAINASMYQQDHRTSVSLMRTRDHTNNAYVSKDMTVLAFDRTDPSVPPVKLIDRECDDFEHWAGKYHTLVQSIRMISCTGKNVWAQQPRRWSTAAIASDRRGRILFIHVRSPYTTHDLINVLLELPLEIRRAMYVEGGPEAQLFVRGPDREHEFVGSFETGFNENDDNPFAWPVPNVIGVVRRDEVSR